MGPLAPGIAVPEELLEVRNMLATRAETWKQQWLQEGRQEGRQEGEAALLVRLLERRFGVLARLGQKIASPPPTPQRWRNGVCASLMPKAWTTSWAESQDVTEIAPVIHAH